MPLSTLLNAAPGQSVYPRYRNTYTAALGTDSLTTSTSYVTLLSLSFTPRLGFVFITMDAVFRSNSVSATDAYMRMVLNGSPVASDASAQGKPYSAHALAYRAAVTPGVAHTIDLQWRSSLDTLICNPVTRPDTYHAIIVAQEVGG